MENWSNISSSKSEWAGQAYLWKKNQLKKCDSKHTWFGDPSPSAASACPSLQLMEDMDVVSCQDHTDQDNGPAKDIQWTDTSRWHHLRWLFLSPNQPKAWHFKLQRTTVQVPVNSHQQQKTDFTAIHTFKLLPSPTHRGFQNRFSPFLLIGMAGTSILPKY